MLDHGLGLDIDSAAASQGRNLFQKVPITAQVTFSLKAKALGLSTSYHGLGNLLSPSFHSSNDTSHYKKTKEVMTAFNLRTITII